MQKIEHPTKPEKITWISQKTWDNFSLKEKDYFIFRYIEWIKKTDLMRRLYLTNNWSFRNFLCKIKSKTKKDLKKVEKFV